jgi:hypothetical protein
MEKMNEVLEPATEPKSAVAINCNLTLRPDDVVSKRLILEGRAPSGVTVNRNDATLDVEVRAVEPDYDIIEVRSVKLPYTDPDGFPT